MKQRPILFSAPMVRALLDGTKTQTRRVCKPAELLSHVIPISDPNATEQRPPNMTPGWFGDEEGEVAFKSPFGVPGDQLWVKEAHYLYGRWNKNGLTKTGKQKWRFITNRGMDARFEAPITVQTDKETGDGWWKRSSLFMPRWASRITLEITSVRVERLQDISEADATAEGTPHSMNLPGGRTAVGNYEHLWECLNGDDSWDLNPWVWVIEFKKVKP